jgi:hypothetical protein
MACFIIVLQLEKLGKLAMKEIYLLHMGNNMPRQKACMARFHAILNSNYLYHHLIPKIRLGIARRTIINPNNLHLEPNQLTCHQVILIAFVLVATLSIGRVI